MLKKNLSLSVVVPSIGRSCLAKTLSFIESWDFSPVEVLVVLPADTTFTIAFFETSLNLIEVRTSRGQVSQRIEGFRRAAGELVLQLDDDILIDNESINLLISAINKLGCCAVAPSMYKYPSIEPWVRLTDTGFTGLRHSVLRMVLGAGSIRESMGRVSRAGVAFPVDPTLIPNDILEVDWTPGGALMHHRRNLITELYFPYQGRASHEDLFHSHILRSAGVKIFTVRCARAYHFFEEREESFSSIFRELMINFDFVKIYGFSRFRFSLWFLYRFFIECANRVISKFKCYAL
jgi:glycosyltransferase involved in cell wall biosynthesis